MFYSFCFPLFFNFLYNKIQLHLHHAADFCSLEYCLKLPRKKYEDNKKTYKALAAAFDCEIVAVEAEYKLTYPNGSEVEPIKRDRSSIEDMIKDIIGGVL
ncbi:Uncharacterised protein [Streptococcus pneumoniae]|nr:Uncharacterised protein [Streptococcus pneumoniae]